MKLVWYFCLNIYHRFMPKKKFYVVWEGHEPGIYKSWSECQKQIKNYNKAVYKSFPDLQTAEEAFSGNAWDFIGKDKHFSALSKEELILIGGPIQDSLSVDAACAGNPGIMEYQGVDTMSGAMLFHQGPFPEGTVNIGEFLALVHGLGYLKQRNSEIPVYSDSTTAISWVRKKKTNTKLERSSRNEKLFELMERAIVWLKNNEYKNKILKWETAAWGEIPADFGRK